MERPGGHIALLVRRAVVLSRPESAGSGGGIWLVKFETQTMMQTEHGDGHMIRLATVVQLTGWSHSYVAKLRRLGVLKIWRPYPKARPWYFRKQIMDFIGREPEQK